MQEPTAIPGKDVGTKCAALVIRNHQRLLRAGGPGRGANDPGWLPALGAGCAAGAMRGGGVMAHITGRIRAAADPAESTRGRARARSCTSVTVTDRDAAGESHERLSAADPVVGGLLRGLSSGLAELRDAQARGNFFSGQASGGDIHGEVERFVVGQGQVPAVDA